MWRVLNTPRGAVVTATVDSMVADAPSRFGVITRTMSLTEPPAIARGVYFCGSAQCHASHELRMRRRNEY
jgi:hypothetical protein